MPRYPVYGRRKPSDDWEHVGYVHAPDREMALGFALHAFFRHGEGVHCAVRDGAELVEISEPGDAVGYTDKSYRTSAGYPLGPKRRKAEQRIAELGVRIDKPRPSAVSRGADDPEAGL